MNKNHMRLTFDSRSENESFARVVVSAFAVQLSPTIEEVADIKTAVSEAVTNAIVHGYAGSFGEVTIDAVIASDGMLTIVISDEGCGIANIEEAMEPFFTTKPELERAGMGFAVMRTFMDEMSVHSELGRGTSVTLRKRIHHGANA